MLLSPECLAEPTCCSEGSSCVDDCFDPSIAIDPNVDNEPATLETAECNAEAMTKYQPYRAVLKLKTNCPRCKAKMCYHSLLYKHRCPALTGCNEQRERRRLEALEAKVARKYGLDVEA